MSDYVIFDRQIYDVKDGLQKYETIYEIDGELTIDEDVVDEYIINYDEDYKEWNCESGNECNLETLRRKYIYEKGASIIDFSMC